MTAASSPSHPCALAIHTSSPDLGLALRSFAGESRCQVWDLGRDLSTHLHLHLAEFLSPQTWQDLALIAVAKGPGGFTGTRIGVVTARILAQQLDVPLFAISSLAAIAQSKQVSIPAGTAIAVQMPAQRGEIFAGIYQLSNDGLTVESCLPDRVLTPVEWQQTLDTWNTPYQIVQAEGGLGATADALLTLALAGWQRGDRPHWSDALPFYGQHPVT